MKILLKIFIITATIFSQASFAYDDSNPEANEFSSISNKIKLDPRKGLTELVVCANKDNKYCAFLLGYLFYGKHSPN